MGLELPVFGLMAQAHQGLFHLRPQPHHGFGHPDPGPDGMDPAAAVEKAKFRQRQRKPRSLDRRQRLVDVGLVAARHLADEAERQVQVLRLDPTRAQKSALEFA